jgi:hypothetical protein
MVIGQYPKPKKTISKATGKPTKMEAIGCPEDGNNK